MVARLEKLVFTLLIGIVLTATISCLLVFYLTLPRPSRGQLCQDLNVHDEDLCTPGSSLYQLLYAAFEPGETRRNEVRVALRDYFLEAHERPVGGTAETYVLVWTPLGETHAYFSFDEDDVLISISVYD